MHTKMSLSVGDRVCHDLSALPKELRLSKLGSNSSTRADSATADNSPVMSTPIQSLTLLVIAIAGWIQAPGRTWTRTC